VGGGHELPRSPDHGFCAKLSRLLDEADFDRQVEERCGPYYEEELGRPSIPLGLDVRMLSVGFRWR
jgi:hypothetical protein